MECSWRRQSEPCLPTSSTQPDTLNRLTFSSSLSNTWKNFRSCGFSLSMSCSRVKVGGYFHRSVEGEEE